MAKAKQLPSGAWRVQVWDADEKKRISFSADTEDEANYKALDWKMRRDKKAAAGITVGEVIDQYIDIKDGVLSPSTVAGYRKLRRNHLQKLADVPVKNLTQRMIQDAINQEAKTVSVRTGTKPSPKTLRNIHGLLSAALRELDQSITLHTTLPAKCKQIVELPPVEDVLSAVKGTDVELPVMLAVWLSLSMSEIRGIQVSAIKDGCVTVKESVVTVDGTRVSKDATKAYERTRKLELPDHIMRLVEITPAWIQGHGYIEPRTDKALYSRFVRVTHSAGLPHLRFHDLRHLNASVMVKLHIPDLYAMERGGWKTRSTLNRVYQHTFSDERLAVDAQVNDFFNSIVHKDE